MALKSENAGKQKILFSIFCFAHVWKLIATIDYYSQADEIAFLMRYLQLLSLFYLLFFMSISGTFTKTKIPVMIFVPSLNK